MAAAEVVTSFMAEGTVPPGDRDPELSAHREQVLRSTSGLAGVVFGFTIAFVGPDAKAATAAERWLVFLAVCMLLLAVVCGLAREWALALAHGTGHQQTVSRILRSESTLALAGAAFLVAGLLFLLGYAAAVLVIG